MKLEQELQLGGVEQDFMNAISAILSQKPTKPELQRRKNLKLNFTTVAIEAGHSRTLIAFEGCAYPRVWAKIVGIKNPGGSSPNNEPPKKSPSQETISKLRQEKRLLQRERDELATKLVRAKVIISEFQKRNKLGSQS